MVPKGKDRKTKPAVVGVPTCRHLIGDLEYDCTQHKYLAALYNSAGVLPLQIPLFGEVIDIDELLDNFNGILLTGSHSNVHPRHYQRDEEPPDFKLDPHRDSTVLPLIKPVVERGIPLLAICRGFQELNVVYGGTLHTKLYVEGSFIEHREDPELPLEQRYASAHTVTLTSGGQLHSMMGVDRIEVNSLHGQGIAKLGSGLDVEGRAEDGLIEAISVRDSRCFALGVQWHPEWKAGENTVSRLLFSAFGAACSKHAAARG